MDMAQTADKSDRASGPVGGVLNLVRFKRCTKCGLTWPAETRYFRRNKRAKDGLEYRCKSCARRDRARWDKSPGRREYMRKYFRVYNKGEARKAWLASNPGLMSEAQARWVAENPEQARAVQRNRRARNSQAPGAHSGQEIQQMYEDQEGVCAYCEIPLLGVYEVEHMTPLSRGGSNDWWNLALSCKPCNREKRTMTALEFALKEQRV